VPAVRIEQPHGLGADEARRRIEAAVEDLLKRPVPGGVEISDPEHCWTGNRLDVSFRVRRGFLQTTLAGVADVSDDRVVVDASLPPIVAAFVGENRIRDTLSEHLARLLA
jgi:hypothetical protein